MFVGIATVLLGLFITFIVNKIREKPDLSSEEWGFLALVFFITGVLIHIICEATQINKWYCTHGNACR